MMRKVPIGLQNFKELRDGDYYYVDKSLMIKEILDSGSEVILYTRPRRFGKSLNLSMLDAFFNLEYRENKWFDGLMISDYPEYNDKKNSFPIISVDLKDLKSNSFEKFIEMFRLRISHYFDEYRYLLDSDRISDNLKNDFRSLYDKKSNQSELELSLKLLSTMLYQHHGVKPIILIDEYDNVIHHTYRESFGRDILDFMRIFLSSALKGNDSLKFAVITGIMQISKESIFSGLNNLKVNNILSTGFDKCFGFTESEVKQMCADYGHPEKFDEAKEWYDGYLFGNAEIYNPWSVLGYIDSGFIPEKYWAGTSGNTIISDLLERTDDDTVSNLMLLASGKSVPMDLMPSMTYDDLENDSDAIYSMLTLTGYLKAVPSDGEYLLSVPNKEMFSVYEKMMKSQITSNIGKCDLKGFRDAMLANDTKKMTVILRKMLNDSVSSRVLTTEQSYQAYMIGILFGYSGRYAIKADFENGNGFYDIMLEKQYGEGPHFIMELKKAKSDASDEAVEKLAKEALRQITDRSYDYGLKGKILMFGIAFKGKDPVILSEEVCKE